MSASLDVSVATAQLEIPISAWVRHGHTPSIQYLFFDNDREILHLAHGTADFSGSMGADIQISYRLHNLSRIVTADAIALLDREGLLSLNQSARSLWPAFPLAEDWSVGQLLQPPAHLASGPSAPSAPLRYALLGHIITRVTGRSYADFVRRRLLHPLHLFPWELEFDPPDPQRRAQGYTSIPNGHWSPLAVPNSENLPWDGLWGSPRGLAAYGQQRLRQRLHSKWVGWQRGTLSGQAYVGASGSGPGYYAELRLYPALGLGSLVLLNRSGSPHPQLLSLLDGRLIQLHQANLAPAHLHIAAGK